MGLSAVQAHYSPWPPNQVTAIAIWSRARFSA